MNSMKKIWTRTTISALLALSSAAAIAAGQVKLVFPDASPRIVWVRDQAPSSIPEGGREFASKEIDQPIPDGLENGVIVVLDKAKGNVAMRKVADAKSTWTVANSDFAIAEAIIQVELDGKPLRSGIVLFDGGGRQLEAALRQGETKLFNVPAGQSQVTVKYGEVGAETVSAAQSLTLSLDRTELVPVRKIAITSSGASGEPHDEDEPSPPPSQQKGGTEPSSPPAEEEDTAAGGIVRMCGQFFLWLLVLAGAAAILVLLVRWLKRHQGKVAGSLQSLGIQIPDGSDTAGLPVSEPASKEVASGAPVVPAGHCPYCGQPEASCQCRVDSPSPSPAAAPAIGAVATSMKLVSDAGLSLAIPDGVSVVGREPGTAQLVVSDPTVSRAHAEIEKSGTRIVVRDKGSSNGTFVNGAKIAGDTEIRLGDTVQFGAVRMRAEA